MNITIANALFGYLKTLYEMNQTLIKLCGIDIIDDLESGKMDVLNIIQNVPRIIPYEYDKKTNLLKLNYKNGLLEFKNEINYLERYYIDILKNNYDFLDDIRKIRNKYEHKMHDVKHRSSGSGSTSLFDFTFLVKDEKITVHAYSFIKLIKEINILFSKIVKDINMFAYKNEKDSYTYYRRITRFNYEDFNKIYDCNLLREMGRAMNIF